MTTVLVTGASGFLASHLLLSLIEKGYDVRGTARSSAKEQRLRKSLSRYAGKQIDLEIVSADLSKDEGWDDAMKGVTYVQHVASPFPSRQPKEADDLIVPARDGTLRVLNAAKNAGVKRVVLTSSVAAIDNGWGQNAPAEFNENHWTNVSGQNPVNFYAQSKTQAEKAAWDFVYGQCSSMDMAVINPVGILGPAMSEDVSTSLSMVVQPLNKAMPAYPRLHQGIVDVRDVAQAHIEAMEREAAGGERFILCSESLWLREVGAILRAAYPDFDVPAKELPNWLLRLMGLFNPAVKSILSNTNRVREYDTRKAKEVLGIKFRSAEESILASAESAIELGIVRPRTVS